MNSRYALIFTVLIALTGLSGCGGEEPAAQNQPAQVQPEPSTPAAPSEQFVSGELQEIDIDGKTFVLKQTNGAEQTFAFNDTTSITGAAGASTLENQEGRPATVRYVDQGNVKSAVQIHIEAGS